VTGTPRDGHGGVCGFALTLTPSVFLAHARNSSLLFALPTRGMHRSLRCIATFKAASWFAEDVIRVASV
jgi:hypothetical protein